MLGSFGTVLPVITWTVFTCLQSSGQYCFRNNLLRKAKEMKILLYVLSLESGLTHANLSEQQPETCTKEGCMQSIQPTETWYQNIALYYLNRPWIQTFPRSSNFTPSLMKIKETSCIWKNLMEFQKIKRYTHRTAQNNTNVCMCTYTNSTNICFLISKYLLLCLLFLLLKIYFLRFIFFYF